MLGGPKVELAAAVRILVAELLVQELAEEVVVAVGRGGPGAVPSDKQVAPLDLVQETPRTADAEDVTAERG